MNISNNSNQFQVEKWIKSVINLETRPGIFTTPAFNQLIKQLEAKQINAADFEGAMQKMENEEPVYIGTAIFMSYLGRHYLVTARHVLENTEEQYVPNYPPEFGTMNLHPRVVDKILIIENGSTIGTPKINPGRTFISHLNTGPNWKRSYIFAPYNIDLAILNLDNFAVGHDRVATLKNMGYVPIELSDIDTVCTLQKGQVIYSIGFTGDFFEVGRKKLTPKQLLLESDLISLPIVSEGTVGDDHMASDYFTGNIFVEKGNSGGAIVSNNKLIGIVSAGGVEDKIVTTETLGKYRSRYIKLIKSSLIKPLLDELSIQAP